MCGGSEFQNPPKGAGPSYRYAVIEGRDRALHGRKEAETLDLPLFGLGFRGLRVRV